MRREDLVEPMGVEPTTFAFRTLVFIRNYLI